MLEKNKKGSDRAGASEGKGAEASVSKMACRDGGVITELIGWWGDGDAP